VAAHACRSIVIGLYEYVAEGGRLDRSYEQEQKMVALNGAGMNDRIVGILHVSYHKSRTFDTRVDYKLLY
jgi:hypothetical protein